MLRLLVELAKLDGLVLLYGVNPRAVVTWEDVIAPIRFVALTLPVALILPVISRVYAGELVPMPTS